MKLVFLFPALLFTLLFIAPSSAQSLNLVKDILPGPGSSTITSYTESGGILYFMRDSSIWKTDGTAAGTVKIFTPIAGTSVSPLTAFSSHIFFLAKDVSHGYEVWTSDGTQAGTHLFLDIKPGAGSVVDSYQVRRYKMVDFNGKLYFPASDGVHGQQLWATDGTTAGTYLAIDMLSSAGAPLVWPLVANKSLFFVSEDSMTSVDKLWATIDGTIGGTVFIKNCNMTKTPMSFQDKMIYVDVNANNINEIWVTGGTTASTSLLTTLPLPATIFFAYAQVLNDHVLFNNKLYLYSRYCKKLYNTDGTQQGTYVVKDSLIPPYTSGPEAETQVFLAPYDGKLYFSAAMAVPNAPYELWQSDGTQQGTHIFTDLTPYNDSASTAPFSSCPTNLTVCNGKLYFKARDTSRVDLWMSDGTIAGTTKIADAAAEVFGRAGIYAAVQLIDPMQAYNNELFFTNTYYTSIGKELYKLGLVTDVKDIAENNTNDFSVYPNPSNGNFVLQLTNNNYTELKIVNEVGQLVHVQALNHSMREHVQLTGLSSGVYFIKLTGKTTATTKKIIIVQ